MPSGFWISLEGYPASHYGHPLPYNVEEIGNIFIASSYAATFGVQAMAHLELGLTTDMTLPEKRIFMETRVPQIFDKIDGMHKVWPAIKLIADNNLTKPCIFGTLSTCDLYGCKQLCIYSCCN